MGEAKRRAQLDPTFGKETRRQKEVNKWVHVIKNLIENHDSEFNIKLLGFHANKSYSEIAEAIGKLFGSSRKYVPYSYKFLSKQAFFDSGINTYISHELTKSFSDSAFETCLLIFRTPKSWLEAPED